MAYNKVLAKRIRELLDYMLPIKEKEMIGSLIFMVNGKMCLGVIKDELMCRIDPEFQEIALQKQGCTIMKMKNRPMKWYVLIDNSGLNTEENFNYWINLALNFNSKAKASKKKKLKADF